ncbi:MAG: phospho-sugar mutase [Geodermatophilaceae bacterium]|nr:phospho-sugar mutase [Geodermatophilaceae bacterium]MDQ3456871.1 phospho-sugar mutase [Actinomycetota bacterium]
MTEVEVRAWIADDPDPATRAELEALLAAGDHETLRDRFGGPLTFGTAGLRGEVRAGPAGMNRAVVRRAAAGLATYLAAQELSGPVVVGYDARRGSTDFARDTAAVLVGAGREALLLPRPLPTPVLAFAVRRLGAAAGVMVTASHNPPQDNGYKVYLADGAQLVSPADTLIQEGMAAVASVVDLPLSSAYPVLGEEIVTAYLSAISTVPPPGPRELTVAYTALHGVGAELCGRAFLGAGFAAPHVVAEQAEPDPAFPTVAFPNPEEPGAVDLLMALADRVGADIAIANDPDADRCAVVCRGRLLRGDEVGVLLADALLSAGQRGTFATTIVSSSMLGAMCRAANVPYAETLTGFKWIVRAPSQTGVPLSFGYEEALGYAVAPALVNDKDGISAALVVAALAARLKAAGRTLLDRLDDLALTHGVHHTDQLSIRVTDLGLITAAMARLRSAPPATLLGRAVTFEDLAPGADVARLSGDGLRVVVRPSGTEPKLKAYLEVIVPAGGSLPDARTEAGRVVDELRAEVSAVLDFP